jgi:hypothetical protein
VDAADIDLRNATYRRFVELGRAPSAEEVAATLALDVPAVRSAWWRLHDAHALVLDETGSIRMANPFSSVPTSFRVEADGRSWFANCGWDGFGIGAALGVDSTIHTECADCHEPLDLIVTGRRPDDTDLVFHVPVPAAEWWVDIGST